MNQEISHDLLIFVQSIAEGDFRDEEQSAFEQLNLIVSYNSEAESTVKNEYFLKEYENGSTHKSSLLLFAQKSTKFSTPALARVVAEVSIQVLEDYMDENIFNALINLTLTFNFTDLINLENEGRQIRFQSKSSSFTIRTDSIYPNIQVELYKLLLTRYSRALIYDGPPNAQELPSIIDRLNTLLRRLESSELDELNRFTALLPFAAGKAIGYSSRLAAKIFDREVKPEEYDEELFRQFQIPLFPTINEDKINILTNKIVFTNEGTGYLPNPKVRIVVGDEEFEVTEQNRTIAPNVEHALYLANSTELANFLSTQNPNVDIKLVIEFKKFNRSYEYRLLSGLVGDWQEVFSRTESATEPDFDIVFPHEMPLNTLSPKGFERLCYWLVEEAREDSGGKRFDKVVWLSEDGGSDLGRDVVAIEKQTGKTFVFQCKRVERFTPSEIENELKTFQGYIQQSPDILPSEYVLFVSAAITSDTKKRGDQWAELIGMEIGYWPKSTIDRLVRENISVRKRFWDVIKKST